MKFVRTEEGDIVVKLIQSLTDLRGILKGKTDAEGKTATALLREERERDKQKDREMMDQLNIETDDTDVE